jgi:uncharacterized protein YegJ (DUF2314 family)
MPEKARVDTMAWLTDMLVDNGVFYGVLEVQGIGIFSGSK